MENQIEQLSVTTLKDTYKIKNRLKVLEEELLSDIIDEPIERPFKSNKGHSTKETPLMKEIKRMKDLGLSDEEISLKTSLDLHDVKALLYQLDGK
jgi:hypothetical protein